MLDIASGEIDPIPSSEIQGLRDGGDAARLALIESRRELSASEASARGAAMIPQPTNPKPQTLDPNPHPITHLGVNYNV